MPDQNTEEILNYFNSEIAILEKLDHRSISNLITCLDETRNKNATVFVIGNGGSASTASHFATDIGVGSLRRQNPIRVISLCDNIAVISALANDLEYDAIFEQQLRLLGKPGDILIAISASGNSRNLLRAVSAATEMGINTFSLTGFDGGELKKLTPGRNVHAQTENGAYGLVEDVHLAICHVVTECIRAS